MREINGKTYKDGDKHGFNDLCEVVSVLRSPVGCAWDRAQTFESLKQCLVNETEETLKAIDNKDSENLCEELGDVLMQVVMNAEIAKEQGLFTIDDVIQGVADKLIRRHPHVFGDIKTPTTAEESLVLWRAVKEQEKQLKANKKNK